jgi:MoaA/NifB/PqqE/SkfB family radical SAM enzyme
VKNLNIIGGEPLQNKHLFRVVECINSDKLGITTNLSCKKTSLDKILNLANKYKEIDMVVSLDSTRENAEFSRYGMEFDVLLDNIRYLIDNSPSNIKITFVSLMTSITIQDFDNIVELMDKFYNLNPTNIKWEISYCQYPTILSLNTLSDRHKPKILERINSIKDRKYIKGLETLEGAIIASKFNKTLYGQMKHFLEEFSSRKNIAIPVILD